MLATESKLTMNCRTTQQYQNVPWLCPQYIKVKNRIRTKVCMETDIAIRDMYLTSGCPATADHRIVIGMGINL